MSVFRIPTDTTVTNYEFFVLLDNVEFLLRFLFNDRDQSWILNILDSNEVLIRAGLKVVNEFPLLRLWQDLNRPAGELLGANEGQVLDPPSLNQLGTDVVLTYLDEAELISSGL